MGRFGPCSGLDLVEIMEDTPGMMEDDLEILEDDLC
jgi:hypothetical protein